MFSSISKVFEVTYFLSDVYFVLMRVSVRGAVINIVFKIPSDLSDIAIDSVITQV